MSADLRKETHEGRVDESSGVVRERSRDGVESSHWKFQKRSAVCCIFSEIRGGRAHFLREQPSWSRRSFPGDNRMSFCNEPESISGVKSGRTMIE